MSAVIIILCATFAFVCVDFLIVQVGKYKEYNDKKVARNEIRYEIGKFRQSGDSEDDEDEKATRNEIMQLLGKFTFTIVMIIFAVVWLPILEEHSSEQRIQRELENQIVQVVVQERIIDRSLGNRVTYIVEKDLPARQAGGELFTWRPTLPPRRSAINQGFFKGDVITLRLRDLRAHTTENTTIPAPSGGEKGSEND